MIPRERTLRAAAALLFLAGCSLGGSSGSASIEGRWVSATEKQRRTLEFLPGGTFVEIREYTAPEGGDTRWSPGQSKPGVTVSAGAYRFPSEGRAGFLHFNGDPVGSRGYDAGWAGQWRVDGQTLTLTKDTIDSAFTREDAALSPAQKELVGLWKRAGGAATDPEEMGVVFTPGGIEVVVGKDVQWDPGTPSECAEWLCVWARYELKEDHTLEETSTGPEGDYRRTRSVEMSGSRLTIRQPGREDLIYERVQAGGLPFANGQLELAKWEALK